MFRNLAEIPSTRAVTAREPTAAAPRVPNRPKPRPASMDNATAKLAPLLMPSTKGPARGFWKTVWSERPDTERATPASSAAATRGRRKSQKIGDSRRPPMETSTGPLTRVMNERATTQRDRTTKPKTVRRMESYFFFFLSSSFCMADVAAASLK